MPEERAGLAVGDHVVLVGNAVDPREAVVTAISSDARDYVLQVTGAPRTVSADLARFTASGFGTVHGAAADGLAVGDVVTVTDEDADPLEATVVAARPGAADLRVRWQPPRPGPAGAAR